MKVKELIGKLRIDYKVELREKNYHLCHTQTKSVLLNAFSECEVIDWFVTLSAELVINIEELPKELLELIERQQSETGGDL